MESPLLIYFFEQFYYPEFLHPDYAIWFWPVIGSLLTSVCAFFLFRKEPLQFTRVVMSFFAGAASPQLVIGLLVALRISAYYQQKEEQALIEKSKT